MNLAYSQDILYLVGAICLVAVTGFLCWALFEIARLVRQTNDVVEEAREKASRIERAVVAVTEKLGATSQYLGLIAEGGRQLLSIFLNRKERRSESPSSTKKKKSSRLSRLPDEEEDEDEE